MNPPGLDVLNTPIWPTASLTFHAFRLLTMSVSPERKCWVSVSSGRGRESEMFLCTLQFLNQCLCIITSRSPVREMPGSLWSDLVFSLPQKETIMIVGVVSSWFLREQLGEEDPLISHRSPSWSQEWDQCGSVAVTQFQQKNRSWRLFILCCLAPPKEQLKQPESLWKEKVQKSSSSTTWRIHFSSVLFAQSF